MSGSISIEWTHQRKLARQRVNVEVRMGRLPRPNALPCTDCGHVWEPGERRHEYDHHRGYTAAHHYDVQAVCTECHSKRDNAKAKQTACVNGHDFTPKNTGRHATGRRFCRACRRDRDRTSHDAAYWRAWRARKKGGA